MFNLLAIRSAAVPRLTRLVNDSQTPAEFRHTSVAWVERPLTDDESAIGQIATWGPAEDWADWADDAAR